MKEEVRGKMIKILQNRIYLRLHRIRQFRSRECNTMGRLLFMVDICLHFCCSPARTMGF